MTEQVHTPRRTSEPQSYEAWMAHIIRHLAALDGEGQTSVQVAEAVDLTPALTSGKLRSLARARICSTSTGWEKPARYWISGAVLQTLRYLEAEATSDA